MTLADFAAASSWKIRLPTLKSQEGGKALCVQAGQIASDERLVGLSQYMRHAVGASERMSDQLRREPLLQPALPGLAGGSYRPHGSATPGFDGFPTPSRSP